MEASVTVAWFPYNFFKMSSVLLSPSAFHPVLVTFLLMTPCSGQFIEENVYCGLQLQRVSAWPSRPGEWQQAGGYGSGACMLRHTMRQRKLSVDGVAF